MAGEKLKKAGGGMVAVGVLLLIFAGISFGIEARTTLRVWLALGLGVVSLGAAVVMNISAVVRFLTTYWLAMAFVLSALVVFLWDLGPLDLEEMILRMGIVLGVDIVLLLVFMFVRDPENFRDQRGGVAANVVFMILIALFLLGAVNGLGSTELTRKLGSLDTTETGVYTLGDRTLGILGEVNDLPAPVHATYLDFGSTYRPMPGQEPLGDRGKEFLKRYSDVTPRIITKVLDPIRDKAEAEDYLRSIGIDEPELGTDDTVIFSYRAPGEKTPNRKDVEVSSWTFMERSQLGTKKFKGEQLYTSAIQDVIYPKRKVYFLKGHGEHPMYGRQFSMDKAADLVRKLALEVGELSLAERGKVPDDADLLVIAGPKTSFVEGEAKAIRSFLEEGKSMVLLVDPQYSLLSPQAEKVRLGIEDWLKEELGIDVKRDHLAMDFEVTIGTTQAVPVLTDLITTADYSRHAIVSDLAERGLPTRFSRAAPVLKEMPEDDEGLTVDELVYVRRTAEGIPYLKTYAARLFPGRNPRAPDPGTDMMDRRLPLGVAAEKGLTGDAPEGGKKKIRVVVIGDSEFATNAGLDPMYPYYAPGNATLFSNAVSWAVKRESLISIEPKTLETETVALDEREERLAKMVALFLLPLLILVAAVGVAWLRRR